MDTPRVLLGQVRAVVLGALVFGVTQPAAALQFTIIDLNPSGFIAAFGRGLSGDQQVGSGSGPATGDQVHALLWTGTADSVVDLHPSGFDLTEATGVSGGQQVGFGNGPATGGHGHALLWTGSADSVVDLHSFLPPGFTDSTAFGIDADGNIVGTASGPTVGGHAFLWRPVAEVAEPGSFTAGLHRAGGSGQRVDAPVP